MMLTVGFKKIEFKKKKKEIWFIGHVGQNEIALWVLGIQFINMCIKKDLQEVICQSPVFVNNRPAFHSCFPSVKCKQEKNDCPVN